MPDPTPTPNPGLAPDEPDARPKSPTPPPLDEPATDTTPPAPPPPDQPATDTAPPVQPAPDQPAAVTDPPVQPAPEEPVADAGLAGLPVVDEHGIDVAAPPAVVWAALLAAVDGAFAGTVASTYARLIRCTHPSSGGPRPLAEGSTIVGFRVATAVPERELDLVGHHVFSTYRLRFVLDPTPGGTRVRAETRAVFPGLHGRLYRTAVVGTGAHVASVRRLLASIQRHAETNGQPEADAEG